MRTKRIHEVNFFQRIAKTVNEKADNSLHEKSSEIFSKTFWVLLMQAVICLFSYCLGYSSEEIDCMKAVLSKHCLVCLQEYVSSDD